MTLGVGPVSIGSTIAPKHNPPDSWSPPDLPNDLWEFDSTRSRSVSVSVPVADFEASNSEYLSRADDAALSFAGDFTIVGWINIEAVSLPVSILSKYTTTGDQREYLINLVAGPLLRFNVSSDGTGANTTNLNASTFGNLSTGTWYFFEAKHEDGVGLSIDINRSGTPDTVAHTGGCFAGTSALVFGALGDISQYYDGLKCSVGMAPSLLSTAVLDSLYNSGSPKLWADLTAAEQALFKQSGGTDGDLWWDLTEVSGTRASASGNFNLTDNATVTAAVGPVPDSTADIQLYQQGPNWPSQRGQTHERGLYFNGINNSLATTVTVDNNSTKTIALLVKLASVSGTIPLGGTRTPSDGWVMDVRSSGKLTYFFAGGAFYQSDAVALDTDWHTVFITDEGDAGATSVKMYVDGADEANTLTSGTGTGTNGDGLHFAVEAGSVYGAITIGYAMVWSKVLTPNEVAAAHNYIRAAVADDGIALSDAGQTAASIGPTNEWPFADDEVGADVTDSIGDVTGQRYPGDTIATLTDAGPNGDDSAQTTIADQPRWVRDGIGSGIPSIRCVDGSTDSLKSVFSSALDSRVNPFYIAAAFSVNSWAGGEYLMADNDSTSIRILNTASVIAQSGNTTYTIRTSASSLSGKYVLITLWNDTSSEAWWNDGTSSFGSSGISLASGVTIGNHNSGAFALNGDIADLVVIDGILSDEEVNNLGRYLARKIGTTWTAIS